MANKFNKGEWSEFYVFIKVLGERQLIAADENLNAIPNLTYPVTKLLQIDTNITREYDLSQKSHLQLTIIHGNQKTTKKIKYKNIKSKTKAIFSDLMNASGSSFSLKNADALINQLSFGKVKAGSAKKGDINIVLRDHITSQDHRVEFSIKSYLGRLPTLLNPSKIGTKFTFKVDGFTGNIQDINDIGKTSKHRKVLRRIEAIKAANGKLVFDSMKSTSFQKNIRKIDSFMPQILGEFLRLANEGHGRTIKELTQRATNSPNISSLLNPPFEYDDLKYKITQLLLNIALGMVPQTKWDGFIKADGGYIVVKKDGEIVCFHVYNISQLGEYLFNNTSLETPSTRKSKYDFATLYKKNSDFYFDLNLQIRFTAPN